MPRPTSRPQRVLRAKNHRLEKFRAILVSESRRLGLNLEEKALGQLCAHYRLLVKWSRAVRLVGSLEPEEVARRHVIESLSLLPYISEPRGSLLDIGSGNGYPALPLKCFMPELRLQMVEPTQRKGLFLQHSAREMGLSDTTVVRARVDHARDLVRMGRWDCITMRAVAAIPLLMASGHHALRPAGRILLLLGERGRREALDLLVPPMRLVADAQPPAAPDSYLVAVELSTSRSEPS